MDVWAAAHRRPKVAIVLAVVLFIVFPLAVDLFLAIPPYLRKAGGWVIVAGFVLACLARLWTIEPGDELAPSDQPAAFNWTSLVPVFICMVMAVPYVWQTLAAEFGRRRLGLEPRETASR